MNRTLQACPHGQTTARAPRGGAKIRAKTPGVLLAGRSMALALALCVPAASAYGIPLGKCSNAQLNGRYVFNASGFTRAPGSVAGTPWVPKAILEVLQFNGDGTVLTPMVTAANPFGDTGGIMQPPGGAPGTYAVNADCTGTLRFLDPSNVTFTIFVENFGATIRMIQTNPANNVFEGTARRSW